jgi:hypothetical protein
VQAIEIAGEEFSMKMKSGDFIPASQAWIALDSPDYRSR